MTIINNYGICIFIHVQTMTDVGKIELTVFDDDALVDEGGNGGDPSAQPMPAAAAANGEKRHQDLANGGANNKVAALLLVVLGVATVVTGAVLLAQKGATDTSHPRGGGATNDVLGPTPSPTYAPGACPPVYQGYNCDFLIANYPAMDVTCASLEAQQGFNCTGCGCPGGDAMRCAQVCSDARLEDAAPP